MPLNKIKVFLENLANIHLIKGVIFKQDLQILKATKNQKVKKVREISYDDFSYNIKLPYLAGGLSGAP